MNDLITKDNQVIKASYRLTPNEQAIILFALSKMKETDEVTDHTFYELNIPSLVDMTGCKSSNNAYRDFKEACISLYRRELMIHNGEKTLTRWVQTVKYVDGQGLIKVRFSADIIPYLINLTANFTAYNLRHVAKFKSSYSLRVYEHIKQWANSKKSIDISIDEIIERFELPVSYKRVAALKERVIEPAKKEINTHSDIEIDYENIKQGRKVIGFKFIWKPNKKNTNKDFDRKQVELSTRQINHEERAKKYEENQNPIRKGGTRKEAMKKALQGK